MVNWQALMQEQHLDQQMAMHEKKEKPFAF